MTSSTTTEADQSCVLIGPSAERYKGGIAQFTSHLADRLRAVAPLHFISWYQLYPSFLISRDFRDRVSKTGTAQSEADFCLGYMNPLSWVRAARKLRDLEPKTVFLTWSHFVHAPVYLFFVFLLKRWTQAEVVYVCHNVLPHESSALARVLSSWCFRQAHRAVVHGRSEAKQMQALAPGIQVTQLFLPLHDFFVEESSEGKGVSQTTAGASSERVILFFGSIRHYKGLDILLRAFALARDCVPNLRLRIVGERFFSGGSFRDRLLGHAEQEDPLALIDSLGLRDIVSSDLRYVPNEDVPGIFRAAELAVFPYRSATQSGPITVAYAYGVPVIATKVGGLPDVVVDGESGYLVEPEDPQALADAIERFFKDPLSSEQVSNVARQLSWERYVSGLYEGEDFFLRVQSTAEPVA